MKKAQMWITDFIIATLIFTFVLITYYTYTSNLSRADVILVDDLIADSESVSSSLLSEGLPKDWSSGNVQKIGLTNNNQRLNRTKLLSFEDLSYNETKKIFGTIYDYLVFFGGDNLTASNVEGICGIGSPSLNVSYDVRSAYYYDSDADSFLKNFMVDELQADVFSAQPGYSDFDVLAASIQDYDFVVVEHPLFSTGQLNGYRPDVEEYVSLGGLFMMGGEIVSGQGKEMLGVKFYKKSGQSESDRNSTVVFQDPFLSLSLNDNIVFAQAYYTENQSSSLNHTEIVKFNSDGKNAVSRWSFGNGSVFYFSDFDVTQFNGDFVDIAANGALKWGSFRCSPIDLDNIKYKNLVRLDRFLIHEGKPTRMVLYLWQ
jgi:hypothetical protein